MKHDRQKSQVEVGRTTAAAIMRTREFGIGVDDVRAGRPPREFNEGGAGAWDYERGRQWAVYARKMGKGNLPWRDGSKINPMALQVFDKAEIS